MRLFLCLPLLPLHPIELGRLLEFALASSCQQPGAKLKASGGQQRQAAQQLTSPLRRGLYSLFSSLINVWITTNLFFALLIPTHIWLNAVG